MTHKSLKNKLYSGPNQNVRPDTIRGPTCNIARFQTMLKFPCWTQIWQQTKTKYLGFNGWGLTNTEHLGSNWGDRRIQNTLEQPSWSLALKLSTGKKL